MRTLYLIPAAMMLLGSSFGLRLRETDYEQELAALKDTNTNEEMLSLNVEDGK